MTPEPEAERGATVRVGRNESVELVLPATRRE